MSLTDKYAKQTHDKYFIDPTITDFSPLINVSPQERKVCLYYIANQKKIDYSLRNYTYCACCKSWYANSYMIKHNATQKHKDAEDLQMVQSQLRI
jgi:hypothetical protein